MKDGILYSLLVVLAVSAIYHVVVVPLTTEPQPRQFPENATVFQANPETGEWQEIEKVKVNVSSQDGRDQNPTSEETGSISVNFRLY